MLLWKQGSQETSKARRENFTSYDHFTEQENKSQSSPVHSLKIALS
jgi:hypothetical protein